MSFLTYDDKNMRTKPAEARALSKKLTAAHKRLETLRELGDQGFFDLPYDTKGIQTIEAAARKVQKKFSHLIVIGIGGSDLGARSIWRALGGSKMWLTFVSNPDPETVSHIRDTTDWSQTAINVISKSGTTLETMSIFLALRTSLIAAVGKKKHAEHVIVTTEASDASQLYTLANGEGYQVLPHPLNVGGRFSVLSVVGLFPAACSGVNIRKIAAGAKSIEDERRRNKAKSLPARFTTHQYLHLTQGKSIHVLMPYADLLSEFGFWYRQIWAESLGKIRDGVRVGPTPVAAFGAIDQHSQIQLYTQGPLDKTVTFLEVATFRRDIRLQDDLGGIQVPPHLRRQSFQAILHAERAGTAHALTQSGCPNGTLAIPKITPEALGALFMFFETATAYMGELMGINTFDQPGVEAGKKEAKRILTPSVINARRY